MEDIVGLPVFERDSFGNTWYYEYEILVDNTVSARDSVVLKSVYLNWDGGANLSDPADDTWAARIDYLWNGQSGTPYSGVVQWNDTDSNGVWDVGEEGNHHFGRLAEVQVARQDGAGELITQKVRYEYFEDFKDEVNPVFGLPEILGDQYNASEGDLCQVTVSTLVDSDEGQPADSFYERVWQYRYHLNGIPVDLTTGTSLTGENHQLLSVFYPEQIEFFADHYAQEAISAGIRTTPFGSVTEAADILRWISFDDVPGVSSFNLGADWEDYFLPNEYWHTLFDVASKVIGYDSSSSRVKTQIVNSGDGSGSSCGCGGSSVGGFRLGKRFDYIYKRFNWSTTPSGVPTVDTISEVNSDGYSCQIVESHSTVENIGGIYMLVYKAYRVHSHDYYWQSELDPGVLDGSGASGVAWKVASTLAEADLTWDFTESDDPFLAPNESAGTGRRWVTMYQYSSDEIIPGTGETFNAFHKVTKQITPSANDWASYVPSTDQGSSTTSVVLPTVLSEGLVYDFDYDRSWRKTTDYRKGSTATVASPTYKSFGASRPDLVTTIQRFPGLGPTGDTPVEQADISYGYHNVGADPNGLIVAWKKIEVTAETMTQNGPDSPMTYTSYAMYDALGQLRWAQEPDGSLTYYGYDSVTGTMNKTVRDATYNGSYVSVDATLPGSFPGLSGSGWTAPSGSAEELQHEYGIDELGRVISQTDASGITRYTRYESKLTDNVETDGLLNNRGVPYFATVGMPYQLMDNSFDGPVSVGWSDAASRSIRTSLYSVNNASSYDPPTGNFTVLDEVSRSDTERMISGLPMRTRDWHRIGDTGGGSVTDRPFDNDGSYTTHYEYDTTGRLTSVVDAEDGVSRSTGHDIRDRALEHSRGMRVWSSGGAGTDSVDTVAKSYYDSGQGTVQGVGNGTLTRSESYDGEGNTRVSKMWFDYRDRMRGLLNPLAPHSVIEYDELNRRVESATVTSSSGFVDGADPDSSLPSAGTGSSSRSTYVQTLYNNRGMVYRTRNAIDPTLTSGTTFLESNSWFDDDGNVVASWNPNSAGIKYMYDTLDRPLVIYQTDRDDDILRGDSGNLADAMSVSSDHVISQIEYSYIPDDQPGADQIEIITLRKRHHDAAESGAGEVTGSLDSTSSVATYTTFSRDEVGRSIHILEYGTNDSDGFVSTTSAPVAPFDTVRATSLALIQSVGFDAWGRVRETIDPEGKSSVTKYDDMSRTVATIETSVGVDEDEITWNATSNNWQVSWPGSAPADQDRVTTFAYDRISNLIKRTAQLNDGSVQVTAYDYGTSSGASTTTMDTLVASSRLLHKVHYPNETTGLADTSPAYTVAYAYNRLGELRGTTDQNGTAHKVSRDNLGRVTSDEVEVFGTNIDSTVQEISASFDLHGRIDAVQSFNGSSAELNSVEFEYTPLHQISALIQNVDVNGTGVDERVEYDYVNAVPSATGGNYSRNSAIRYPSQASGITNTVEIDYSGTTGFDVINDRISRVAGYGAPSWGHTGLSSILGYSYLGQSTAAMVDYPTKSMSLDYTRGFDGSSVGGDYPGFDQYGRVVWHAWMGDGFTTGTNPGFPNTAPLMARRYGYDKMSNRTSDWDGRPGIVPAGRDWDYEYDSLDRLETATRSSRDVITVPVSTNTIAASSRQWMLDMLGNWNSVATDDDGDGLFEAGDETEIRTYNLANEIESREGEPGAGPGGTTQLFEPSYDDAGNYRDNMGGANNGLKYTHDAWNRLVRIDRTASGGDFPILENTFNGLNWRIRRQIDRSKGSYDGIDEQRDYYYSAGWQMIEERVDDDLDGSIDYTSQQVWGGRYIDDAVAKKIDRDNNNVWTDIGDSAYFYLTDVMFSARALVNDQNAVEERIDYTPYGVAMHRYGSDLNEDGAFNFLDVSLISTAMSNNLEPGDAGYDADVDVNGDGSVNFLDYSAFLANYTAHNNPNGPSEGWVSNLGFAGDSDNSIGYDGYAFDFVGATDAGASGLYVQRNRFYDIGLGSWLSREPLSNYDRSTLYGYVAQNPLLYSDPYGLQSESAVFQDGCDTISTSISVGRSIPSGGVGLSISASFQVTGQLEYQRCETCCKDGGTGIEHTLSANATASASVTVTAGIGFDVRMTERFYISGYLGLQGEGSAVIDLGGGQVQWTDCEGDSSEASFILCGQGSIDFTARGGMMMNIHVGWFHYQTGAEAYLRSTTAMGICLECNTGGCELIPERSGFGTTRAYWGFNVCAFGGCYSREYFLGQIGGGGGRP